MGESESAKQLKQPTTFQEQVELLKSRNLIIPNEHRAMEILKKVNYYRLSAYFLSVKQENDVFKDGVTFNQIYRLYEFDMKLRNLLMEQLESIEVAFRTHIAYLLAHKYGTLGYTKGEHFASEENHSKFLGELQRELERQKELYIKHHLEKYDGQFPIWVAVEIISFGALSKLYSNMKPEDQKTITGEHYRVPHDYVNSWLKVLSHIRNVCAHFGRLYNKILIAKPRLFKEDHQSLGNNKIFAPIFIMRKLIAPNDWNRFVIRLEALIDEYKDEIELDKIGFPLNWNDLLRKP